MMDRNIVGESKIQEWTNLPTDGVIVIDTETTGLDPGKDEVLSLAICDLEGNTLFYHLIRPVHRKTWKSASEINGIYWKDVKNEKPLCEYESELMDIWNNARYIVGYNVEFDLDMLAYRDWETDRKSTRLNSSHSAKSRMPSSA